MHGQHGFNGKLAKPKKVTICMFAITCCSTWISEFCFDETASLLLWTQPIVHISKAHACSNGHTQSRVWTHRLHVRALTLHTFLVLVAINEHINERPHHTCTSLSLYIFGSQPFGCSVFVGLVKCRPSTVRIGNCVLLVLFVCTCVQNCVQES